MPGLVRLDLEADAFLHHMVRNIAGVLIAIGQGDRPEGWAAEVLALRDRTLGGVTAPPDGLYLTGVEYPPQFAVSSVPAATSALELVGFGLRQPAGGSAHGA
jgi:tRNA pseudouridine38-40 synthase